MATDRDDAALERILAQARRERTEREKGYREQALRLYPKVCARCGREFSGRDLRMLTVHHKDHDHDHNPADGSNWELLCLYCHDNEHARVLEHQARPDAPSGAPGTAATHRPFAGLEGLLKGRK